MIAKCFLELGWGKVRERVNDSGCQVAAHAVAYLAFGQFRREEPQGGTRSEFYNLRNFGNRHFGWHKVVELRETAFAPFHFLTFDDCKQPRWMMWIVDEFPQCLVIPRGLLKRSDFWKHQFAESRGRKDSTFVRDGFHCEARSDLVMCPDGGSSPDDLLSKGNQIAYSNE